MSIIEKAAQRIDRQRALEAAAANAGADAAVLAPSEAAAEALDPAPAQAPAQAPVPAPAAPLLQASSDPGPAVVPGKRASTRRVEIDLARMAANGMVTAASGRTMLLEDFRIIKRPLLNRAFGDNGTGKSANPANLIMVTSSLPGEGKTYCAINLAMSIAMELDHTVLLVDADVARPSVMRTLGLPNQRGLMDILLNEKTELGDVLLRTNVETLTILPAGTSNARATELLASQATSSLIKEIANRYPDRIVIFDSPPLLLTSEARVLASHMGQIVMVVEAEKTTQHAVKQALAQLEGFDNVNLIYNKSREFAGLEETYDYHYG